MYLLFYHSSAIGHGNGGMNDFHSSHATQEEAESAANCIPTPIGTYVDYAQVLDTEGGQCNWYVRHGNSSFVFRRATNIQVISDATPY
jgi:hypothetical protein